MKKPTSINCKTSPGYKKVAKGLLKRGRRRQAKNDPESIDRKQLFGHD